MTIIFSDLKGSTALTERIDAEAINEVKERYFAAMAAEITRHGGKIEKYIGDAIMAVFGLPRAHEDDALRAVRAASRHAGRARPLNVDLLELYGVEIAARTGVNTGEVVANADPTAEQQLATGDAVNVAARLEQAAPANEVLIGEVTYGLVRAAVEVEAVEPLELKGKAERVPAYRLVAVRERATERSPASRPARRARRAARAELDGQLRDGRRPRRSRLVDAPRRGRGGQDLPARAFEESPGDTVLQGRCLPYGDGITFWPLVEIVTGGGRDRRRRHARGRPHEARRCSKASRRAGDPRSGRLVIGLTADRFSGRRDLLGDRRFLEALGSRRPVVVCIEDVHNAEATFLDLLEHVLDTDGAPIGRPRHRHWPPRAARQAAAMGRSSRRPGVTVPALDAPQTERLVEVLLGGTVDDAIAARVVETSMATRCSRRIGLDARRQGLIRHDGVAADGRPARRRRPADDPGAARRTSR